MKRCILLTVYSFIAALLRAQTGDDLIKELRLINSTVVHVACSTGKGNLISNRAMNIFLSGKLGSYLIGDDDLSLYKNSVAFNASDGVFSISHNLRQAPGTDEPVKSFLLVGARANIIHPFAAAFSNRHAANDFGLLVKQVWMGKTTTYFKPCTAGSVSGKQLMDAERLSILHLLETSIQQETAVFEKGLADMDTVQVPETTRQQLRKDFYVDLKENYNRKFAELQSEVLTNKNYYRLIKTHWTSISAYLPVIRERFYVAESFATDFAKQHLYPASLYLTHTRFWESSRSGRIFLKLNAAVFANNSYHSKSLERLSIADYKSNGGSDTLGIAQQNSGELLVGKYDNFFTPLINASLVYIPANSHVGISGTVEQNFGTYHALNGKIGVPVVLIDKKGVAAVTFEFQVRFFDLANKVKPLVKRNDKTTVGFSIGIPFSKVVY